MRFTNEEELLDRLETVTLKAQIYKKLVAELRIYQKSLREANEKINQQDQQIELFKLKIQDYEKKEKKWLEEEPERNKKREEKRQKMGWHCPCGSNLPTASSRCIKCMNYTSSTETTVIPVPPESIVWECKCKRNKWHPITEDHCKKCSTQYIPID